MGKQLIATGQATVIVQKDSYTINQSVSEYIFTAQSNGTVPAAVSFSSTVKITIGDQAVTDFTIGAITKPSGFSVITVNNTNKTITYSVAAGTTTLADSGLIAIPVIIAGMTYQVSFAWSKAKTGATGSPGTPGTPGTPGADANLLDWVADWNNGKTTINGNVVITPKIFAGAKNPNNTITGTAIGRFNLSTLNASGVVTTETIDGVYGFKDGNRTFSLDNTGSVQLGRGNQYIKYNAVTGRVEFGSDVSLAWIGATFIDRNGIFTGTLSASTVNAIQLNASQIVAGTINAARIDVASLKASLITAGNIEALTLNVIRGKIGGWSIDTDSIYRGVKNNTSGAYTAASGAITIGSNGIRGLKWRLDSTGAGAVAGGNISWDASGNVTFAASVSLQWTTSINSITTSLGGTNYPKLTQISATGIYTGTLTATQVNAVEINAGSIKAGTLSADRISVNSLNGNKITARTISADRIIAGVITANEIAANTITAAKIAARTITADRIVAGAITANEIAAKTITAAKITAGTITATEINVSSIQASVVTAGAVNGLTCTFVKGSIGGWTINSTQIYKGSVYLGIDGSIVNGTKWQLNNNGSGRLANGNITWDAAGAVTFGASVSLQWKNDIEASKSTNYGYRYYTKIIINGESGKYYPVVIKGGDQTLQRDLLIKRGYSEQAPSDWANSTTHKGGLNLLIKTNFGGWGGAGYSWNIYELEEVYCRMFAGASICGNCCMFAAFLRGGGETGAAYHIYSQQPLTGRPYSEPPVSTQAPQICYNSDLIFKTPNGSSGYHTANAPAPRTITSAVETEIKAHKYASSTHIDSNGIYTGTLNANQITAGTISADRIATNSLHGNRITARTISADRIVAGVITANEIAGNTITAAKIAARTISADRIATGVITANEIASDAITAIKIAARVITANKIATGTITANEINVGSIQASVVTAAVINGLTCTFTKGKIGGFEIYEHKILARETNNGAGISHYIEIQSNGYICNARTSDNKDFWALHRDGSAEFGLGKIKFGANGDGWLANKNITWDVNGNVSMTGTISATTGKIGNFNISGGKLVNSTTTASIEFSGLAGSSLYLNSGSSLISIRSDTQKTGIYIQTYSSGAKGIYVLANAGSTYAIESYGPIQFGQRSGEKWCMPGVLYVGCKYSAGYNNYYRKIWGDGMTVSSFSHIGEGKYRVYHNLGHTDYTVTGMLWNTTTYYGYFRLLERTNSYFTIQNIGSSGKPDQAAFDFIVYGRNRW